MTRFTTPPKHSAVHCNPLACRGSVRSALCRGLLWGEKTLDDMLGQGDKDQHADAFPSVEQILGDELRAPGGRRVGQECNINKYLILLLYVFTSIIACFFNHIIDIISRRHYVLAWRRYMKRLELLKRHLKPGTVYRRADLAQWSKSVDRHAGELVKSGVLQKLRNGLYYYPKPSAFGPVPADEKQLLRKFLEDDKFLVTSPNAYNALGMGTTQLYNTRVVYNRKRHGVFKLGGQTFDFRRKYSFPKKITEEFLLVDFMNNLKSLAEDQATLRMKVREKAMQMEPKKLKHAVREYANTSSKKYFDSVLKNAS